MVERARAGEEACLGAFGVHPRLEGMARQLELRLRLRQRLACRHPELPLDEVHARHHLGDGVLDLQPGVHLHEVEGGRIRRVRDELDRPRALVVDRLRGAHRRHAELLAQRLVDPGRRCLFENLLVASLDGAVALEEVDRPAVLVAEHLHLDVPRRRQVALDEKPVVSEGGGRLALSAFDRCR